MVDFKQELERYKPILSVEKIEDTISTDEIHDIIDLLAAILKNVRNE